MCQPEVRGECPTGESLPVEKDTEPLSGETALGDRKNMVFSGSFVTYGRGRFLVTATGMDTEMGKIAQLLKNTEERKTPLQVSLDQFGRKLSIIILVICAVLFGVSVLWRARKRDERLSLRRGAGGGRYPGGPQFHRDHRAVLRHPENGQGKRHHPPFAGGGGAWQRVGHLLG